MHDEAARRAHIFSQYWLPKRSCSVCPSHPGGMPPRMPPILGGIGGIRWPARARRLGAPPGDPPEASQGSLNPAPMWARPCSRPGAQLGPRAARSKKNHALSRCVRPHGPGASGCPRAPPPRPLRGRSTRPPFCFERPKQMCEYDHFGRTALLPGC